MILYVQQRCNVVLVGLAIIYDSVEIDGKHHRDNDLPAIEYKNGSKEWRVIEMVISRLLKELMKPNNSINIGNLFV